MTASEIFKAAHAAAKADFADSREHGFELHLKYADFFRLQLLNQYAKIRRENASVVWVKPLAGPNYARVA